MTVEVSTDSRSTYVLSTDAAYSALISATAAGALTLSPTIAAFGAGADTASTRRDIRVTYKNSITDTFIQDIFRVDVYSTAAYAKLANDQLDTMSFTPHPDVIYTVAQNDLNVPKMDTLFKNPVDISGFNDFSSMTLPLVTYTLEYLSVSTWTALTSSNYQTAGVIGLSTTPCMKSSSLGTTYFEFTLSCSDNTKFGQDTSGRNVY